MTAGGMDCQPPCIHCGTGADGSVTADLPGLRGVSLTVELTEHSDQLGRAVVYSARVIHENGEVLGDGPQFGKLADVLTWAGQVAETTARGWDISTYGEGDR